MREFEETSVERLDRFVDGELTDSERRDVLLAADREPDVWRRLALAFVEGQTLRGELSAILKPAANSPPKVIPPTKTRTLAAVRGVSFAACCVLAFGLGRWSTPADARMASGPEFSSRHLPTFAANEGQLDFDVAGGPDDTQEHQTMRLVLDDLLGGPPQSVEVPVVNELAGDPTELLNSPPVISPEIQRALLRTGRRVREQRELFEVQLPDGRHGIVPVSNVLVENSGLDVFQ